jgi:signal peptidase I
LWKNEYFNTALTMVLLLVIVFGFWYGSQIVLNTGHPFLAVASGSMCRVEGMQCDGWSHPFSPTLHTGDLIVIQGISSEQIKTGPYPYGDIIVFYRGSELIVHRAISNYTIDDVVYFITKGDMSGASQDPTPVPQDKVVGKVVLRVPWLGHIALFLHNSSGIFIIILLMILVIIVEFAIPALSSKEGNSKSGEDVEKAFEA